MGTPEDTKQAAIVECRAAYGQMLEAHRAWKLAYDTAYNALNLSAVEDGDFDDGLLASEFTTTAANMIGIDAEFTSGVVANLRRRPPDLRRDLQRREVRRAGGRALGAHPRARARPPRVYADQWFLPRSNR